MRASALTAALAGATVVALVTAPVALGAEKCLGERATILGPAEPDVIAGTGGDDLIVARGGSDVVVAGRGADIVCAGRGHDLVVGGGGHDRIRAGLSVRRCAGAAETM